MNMDKGIKIGHLENVPENVSYLAEAPNSNSRLVQIDLVYDAKNQHIKISNYQPPEYYEDYFMTATYSRSMQELQKSQVSKLAGLNIGVGGYFLEVGCGDGSFLKHAKKKFNQVVGIEPSKKFAEASKSLGFKVIDGYVTASNLLTSEKFDAFASRQVFEHLEDPLDCLLGIRQMLNPGAVGLIEVPNGYRALREKRFYEFFPDHINYFSVNSLVNLANVAGFNVISCAESFGGDYLELWIRNDINQISWGSEIEIAKQSAIKKLSKWIDSAAGEIGIFGCGAKTLTIMTDPGLNSKQIKFAIDSDPSKIGKYIPGSTIKIMSITDPLLQSLSEVFVLALSYREEIATIIKNNLPGCNRILTFDNNGEIIDLI
jgi:SAM-dependent methyltransferase